jgi:hypothetical protein
VSDAESADVSALNAVERELLSSLALTVSESGPLEPWVVQVTNIGARSIRLAADARLLAFEVSVPGRKKPEVCRIPAEMRPTSIEQATPTDLSPRQSFTFRIDPRFYCFEEGEQSLLVPGAQLTPMFGWPEATKTVWKKGQRVEVRPEQVAPFAAQLSPPGPKPAGVKDTGGETQTAPVTQDIPGADASESATKAAPEAGAVTEPPTGDSRQDEAHLGLKQISGGAITLGNEYVRWAPQVLSVGERAKQNLPPLELEIVRGSDSVSARNARVTVRLTNHGPTPNTVFFRREHLTFMLLGPEGLVTCPAPDEERAPDAQEFTRLAVGRQVNFVTQVLEFCETSHLDRPGFYLVGAEANLTDNGSAANLTAFTGKLFSTQLRPLRVRTGSSPFVLKDFLSVSEARKRFESRKRTSSRARTQAIGGPFRAALQGGVGASAPAAPQPAPPPQAPPDQTTTD